MQLKYQLFFTLLVAGTLLVTVMFLVSSYTFSRGFLGYINNADNDFVQALVSELENQYTIDQGWQNTVTNNEVWDDIFVRTRQIRNAETRAVRRSDNRSSGNENRNRNRRPPPPRLQRIKRRVVLADSDKKILIGELEKKSQPMWQSINHQGTVVGFLALKPLRQVEDQFDQAFEKQQKKSFAIAGLSMVLLSALLAAPLASRIVKPIIDLQKSVAQISKGTYGHQINTDRNDEIGDLTADINKLDKTLEQNREARRQMFAEVSHELRTPVAVLRSELEAIQDGIRDADSTSIDSLHTETMKLTRLIDDLKTLSLSDAGGLEYEMQQLDLSKLIQEGVSRHEAEISDLKITTIIEPSVHINGDQERLEQLIANLLQNSLRYTNTPGAINISLSADKQSVNLDWSDSAPGVPDSALEKLFDPLFRAEQSRSRKLGGSGLGLSIVKNITTAHDGTCSAAHSEAGGLSIRISFPSMEATV